MLFFTSSGGALSRQPAFPPSISIPPFDVTGKPAARRTAKIAGRAGENTTPEVIATMETLRFNGAAPSCAVFANGIVPFTGSLLTSSSEMSTAPAVVGSCGGGAVSVSPFTAATSCSLPCGTSGCPLSSGGDPHNAAGDGLVAVLVTVDGGGRAPAGA